jgi:hypothetical protein
VILGHTGLLPEFRCYGARLGISYGERVVVATGHTCILGRRSTDETLHELGHTIDWILDSPSNSDQWQAIYSLYGQNWRSGRNTAATAYEGGSADEYFAGCFASYFGSDSTRRLLPWEAGRFIENILRTL